MAVRPFRFGALSIRPSSGAEWLGYARKVEALGYSTIVKGLHPSMGGTGAIASLAAAAAVTTTLRFATHVLPIDFYALPTLLQEAATLDLLSDGRLEFGIGAGWLRGDYDLVGLPFQAAGVRIDRLAEAVALLKRLFAGETVTHSGAHYHFQGYALDPAPVQRPRPPLLLGGGGRRALALAAREADIVSIDVLGTPAGTKDWQNVATDAVAQKIAWVREAAGERFDALELHILALMTVVAESRQAGAAAVADQLAGFPPTILSNTGMNPAEIAASPHVLVGSAEQIAETLLERRERYGLSYVTVPGNVIDDFAPVVARLAGT